MISKWEKGFLYRYINNAFPHFKNTFFLNKNKTYTTLETIFGSTLRCEQSNILHKKNYGFPSDKSFQMNPTFKSFEAHTDLIKAPIKQPSLCQIKLYSNNYKVVYIVSCKIMKKQNCILKILKYSCKQTQACSFSVNLVKAYD